MVMSTREQSYVTAALNTLKFEMLPPPGDPPIVGGPASFKVTDATLEFLKGKTVTVDSDASVTVE